MQKYLCLFLYGNKQFIQYVGFFYISLQRERMFSFKWLNLRKYFSLASFVLSGWPGKTFCSSIPCKSSVPQIQL